VDQFKRRKFSEEFRSEAVKLVVEGGLTQAQTARDLGVSETLVGRWVRDARARSAPGALTADERAELARLRKEVATLKFERDLLKKATAFFARDSK
jgi:transposase